MGTPIYSASRKQQWKEIASRPGKPWPEMTWPEFADLCRYVWEVRECFNLTAWEIEINNFPIDDDSTLAAIDPLYGREQATMTVCRYWSKLPAEKKRHFVTHELLHLIFEHTARAAMNDQDHLRTPNERATFKQSFTRVFEHAIDHTAVVLSERLPKYPERKQNADNASDSGKPAPGTSIRPKLKKRRRDRKNHSPPRGRNHKRNKPNAPARVTARHSK